MPVKKPQPDAPASSPTVWMADKVTQVPVTDLKTGVGIASLRWRPAR